MLICPKCGFDNELGRIFCHQCGTKLDLDQVKTPGQGGPRLRRRRQGTFGRVFRRAIGLAVLASLGWVIWLAFQVPDVHTTKPTNADLLAADNKHLDLEQLVARKRPAILEVTQAELNTYLRNLGFGKPGSKPLRIVPKTLQTEVRDGTVTLKLLGELQIGEVFSKRLFISYTGVPVVEDDYFELKPVAGAIGKVPLHPKLLEFTNVIQNLFARLFGHFHHEHELLSQLSAISIIGDRILLSYQPKQDDKAAGANR